MSDYATWVSFQAAEIELLRGYLRDAKPLTEDECVRLLERIEAYLAPNATDQRFRAGAKKQSCVRDGECEIDDHAVVSSSDNGAYVMAWVWCPNEDAGVDPETDDGSDG